MLHCRLFVFSISTAVSSSVHDSSARLASSRPIGRSVKFSVWMMKEGGGRLAIATKFLENDRINRTTFGQFVPRRTHVNSSLTTSWACRLAGGGLQKHRISERFSGPGAIEEPAELNDVEAAITGDGLIFLPEHAFLQPPSRLIVPDE